MLTLFRGVESAKGDALCRHKHRFRRKLGVTQGVFCLLQASLPKLSQATCSSQPCVQWESRP